MVFLHLLSFLSVLPRRRPGLSSWPAGRFLVQRLDPQIHVAIAAIAVSGPGRSGFHSRADERVDCNAATHRLYLRGCQFASAEAPQDSIAFHRLSPFKQFL
jgi:hypothetical protein